MEVTGFNEIVATILCLGVRKDAKVCSDANLKKECYNEQNCNYLYTCRLTEGQFDNLKQEATDDNLESLYIKEDIDLYLRTLAYPDSKLLYLRMLTMAMAG